METDFHIENIITELKQQAVSSGLSVADQYLATPYYKRRMKEFKNHENLVIAGSGTYGLRLFEMLEAEGIASTVSCFCDNSRERHELKIRGRDVLSVEEAALRYPSAHYIITPRYYENELLQQLVNLEIAPGQISIFTFAYTGLVD